MELEERIIVLCACGAPDDPAVATALAPLLDDGVDWSRLLRLALQNRVLVPVARSLAPVAAVPAEARRALAVAALRLREEAVRTAADFARALPEVTRRHRVVLLRGIALHHTLYRDRFTRPIGDVDLLIERPTAPSLSGRFEDHYHVEGAVEALRGRATIEYHRDPGRIGGLRVARFDLPGLWRRSVPLTLAGCAVAVLAPEDALVVSAHHAARRGMTGLYRFVDLLHLVRAGIDWDVAVRRARASGTARALWSTAVALEWCAPGVVPPAALAALRPPRVRRWVLRRLFDPAQLLHDPNPQLRRERGGRARNVRKQALRLCLLVDARTAVPFAVGALVVRVLALYAALLRLPRAGARLRAWRAALQGEPVARARGG